MFREKKFEQVCLRANIKFSRNVAPGTGTCQPVVLESTNAMLYCVLLLLLLCVTKTNFPFVCLLDPCNDRSNDFRPGEAAFVCFWHGDPLGRSVCRCRALGLAGAAPGVARCFRREKCFFVFDSMQCDAMRFVATEQKASHRIVVSLHWVWYARNRATPPLGVSV